ncbi:MAG: elongation factor P maturation arginine rhamnosyltransferase EarP [Fusobacterium sp.]|uniref:elongation factor P maturation arginine rhamnosyltransferase EarP n=1 Tax=Fusobacterium sp. TaxID=68766 RepID=UPI0026DD73EA|nr:elongation factor P maturation arginine rhamnosyltransferase EarP [Fusobacterium sp.]MDO4689745.1 elongation factor P maturation arginine rhamnosyltransferase EarP [Fusobacterium sp.]
MEIKSIDIFCEVIDNYGDVGVAYRLAREFKFYFPDRRLRLIIDRTEELRLIKKDNDGIDVLEFSELNDEIISSDLIIECFACKIPDIYMEKAYNNSKILLNLEYFSSEDWIENFHLQESLIGKGSLKKYFFMPGISLKSGGIIIDREFISRKEKVIENKSHYLKKFGIEEEYDLIGSIFSYEKNFDKLIFELERTGKKILLLIMSEKTQKNFTKYFDNINIYDKIQFVKLPFYSYDEYEEILALCDFNFVRGEDSFVRALLLGKPFLWHIYPQKENVHMIKLKSFLDKYYGNWEELKDVFIKYNLNNDDYEYFFKNYDKISYYNQECSKYLLENCNLVEKLNNFLENLGGNK